MAKVNKKTFDRICAWIEEGQSLRWCLRQEGTPSSSTFYEWLDSDEKLSKQYARATELRAEAIFEEILEISDTTEEGTTIQETDNGTKVTKGDMIQHRRLKVDARKWMLSKMVPKKYGDRLGLDHSGAGFVVPVLENGKELPDEDDLSGLGEDDILA